MEGININDADVLADVASEFGSVRDDFIRTLRDPKLATQVTDEFASARTYGTNALPNVLWESEGARALLAGGYADADMLVELIDAKKSSLVPV